MHYFGGKSRVAFELANYINRFIGDKDYYEPFCGACWVTTKIKAENRFCSDKNEYLIAMWKALQKGWEPPDSISKEEYHQIKNNENELKHLKGFAGFGCSFSGKWFGSYAKDNTGRNYCLNAKNSLFKKMKSLKDVKFSYKDYKKLNTKNAIIYCDPPYENTNQPYGLGKFDTKQFWEVMREWSKDNIVFVSSYEAPEDFKVVWGMATMTDIRSNGNKGERIPRIERMFSLNNI